MNQELITVSLTSFPTRISYVHIAVQSLLRQSYRNLRVVLWLSLKQFPDKTVPDNLSHLTKYGLEIRFVEDDIRSHKKYYYIFKESPSSLVFLADDDIIYPSWIVEDSFRRYTEAGGMKVIIGNYGRTIIHLTDGSLAPYSKWPIFPKPSDDVFFGSGGGTLLRPCDLYKDICEKDLFLKFTPTADDIWLNAMARLGENTIKISMDTFPLPVMIRKNRKLANSNLINEEANDKQLVGVQNYYYHQLGKKIF